MFHFCPIARFSHHRRSIVRTETAAIFGPSRTTVTDAVARRIHALVTSDSLQSGEFLFHAINRRAALDSSDWTRFVKRQFKTYAGELPLVSNRD